MNINHSFYFKILLTGTLVFNIFFLSVARENKREQSVQGDTNYSIRWISQYPTVNKKKETKQKNNEYSGILRGEENKETNSGKHNNWFTNLLFGKRPANIIKPMSVVAINPDTFWVADQGNGSILRVFKGVGEITQFGKKEPENIPSIVGSCFTADGKILFTDSKLNKIFRFVPGNKELQILNDSISLDQPTGIAYSAIKEEIWVVETKAHRIAVLNKEGALLKQIGTRGNAPGEFNFPTYIWIDKSGTVYVVDAMNFRIQIFDSNGDFKSTFGEIGDASGYFARPKGVATDSFGHIYVTDALYHAVQVFDQSGKLLYIFGSKGREREQFWMPTGIYIDASDFIYIADSYNSRIQIFQLSIGE